MKKYFLLLCLILFAFPARAAQTVKIGFLGPLTGCFANVGTESKQVLTILASDINGGGGLLGRKVELVFEHEGDKVQAAQEAAKRLIRQGVVAVIGPHTSDMTEAVQDILNDGGIIQLSYGSTAVSLTEKGLPRFFRTCPRDDEQAKAFVRILRKLNFRRVALLNDQSLYGKSLAGAIDSQLHAWMLQTVYFGALTPGLADYSDTLEKIRATAPDIIFFAGYYPGAARLLQARQRLQWKIPLMAGDGVNNPELVKMAGQQAAGGFHFLSPPNPEHLDSPQAKAFLDRFRSAYQQKPSSIYPLLAGDAFLAFVQSATQVQTTGAQAVSDYLHTKYFNKSGLTGEIFFNVWGDVVNDLYAVYYVDDHGSIILKKQLRHGDFIQ